MRELEPQIVTLSTDIGRGHPSYLDSVLELLGDTEISCSTVMHSSKGLSLFAWKGVSLLYLIGGRGGHLTRFYNSFRRTQGTVTADSPALRLLGRDLKRKLEDFRGICLVAHPLVARILSPTCRIWYLHGEIAAPAECVVKGAERIFVPLEETGKRLIAGGADSRAIVVTGLVVEPDLVKVKERAFSERIQRLRRDQWLTVGFFTSGAYPHEHLARIVAGVKSVVRRGMRAVVFAGTNPKYYKSIKASIRHLRVIEDLEHEETPYQDWDVRLVGRRTRREETKRAIELNPGLDVFVAASHERTNWGVGLGLPMFVLFPLIGTFAAHNFDFARRQGVACPLFTREAAGNLGRIVSELRRSGKLIDMAERGFGVLKTDGAHSIAAHLLEEVR